MALTDEDKQWISDRLEAVETKLLTAFHQWASPAEIRIRTHRDSIHALEVEMDVMRERIQALEDKNLGKA